MYKYIAFNNKNGYFDISKELLERKQVDTLKASYTINKYYRDIDNYSDWKEIEHGFIYGETEEELQEKATELSIAKLCGKISYIWKQKYNQEYIRNHPNNSNKTFKLDETKYYHYIISNSLENIMKKYNPSYGDIKTIDFGNIELISEYKPKIKLNDIHNSDAIKEAALLLEKKRETKRITNEKIKT